MGLPKYTDRSGRGGSSVGKGWWTCGGFERVEKGAYDGGGASTVGEGGVWNGSLTADFSIIRILSCNGGLKDHSYTLVGGIVCVCV